MQVTEVRIKLMEQSEDRLRAFCSITLDHEFVIRDLKIIDGVNGPFVAMPSRKLSGHCPRCGYKNHLRAAYCNQCGAKLRITVTGEAPQKLYADVAHPINSECREMVSAAVLTEFQAELQRAAQPGYRSRYDDEFEALAESSDDRFTSIDRIDQGPRSDPVDGPSRATPPPPHLDSPSGAPDSIGTGVGLPPEGDSSQKRPASSGDPSHGDSGANFGAGIFES